MSPLLGWSRGVSPFPEQMGAPYQDNAGLKQARVNREYKETSRVKNLISMRFLPKFISLKFRPLENTVCLT